MHIRAGRSDKQHAQMADRPYKGLKEMRFWLEMSDKSVCLQTFSLPLHMH